MSESKTYVFGENGTSQGGGFNSILAMLPALMQRQGVDPSLFALCNGKGNGGGWGNDLFAILLLFIIMGRGNFFGGSNCGGFMPNGQGGVAPMINNDANTAVIMQAVQRNGFDVQSLATALNTTTGNVIAAINGVSKEIYLEKYDWTVHVMYDVHSKDAMKVRRYLRDLGCTGIPLEDACNLVLKGEPNKGITYSNVDTRKTVVVIGWTTSRAEYMNSLSHEMLHVVQHISEQFLINMYGEEACYLLGGLVQACIRKG